MPVQLLVQGHLGSRVQFRLWKHYSQNVPFWTGRCKPIGSRFWNDVRYHVPSMNRRDLLKLGASAAAVPAAGLAQQHDEHATPAQKVAKAATEWRPELLDDHQNQTVMVLVDLIIPATDTPGAKAALVNRHIDHLLAAA